jgi:hypothetical protein
MKIEDYALLVQDMRRKQADYFRFRIGRDLSASKAAEKRVDAATAELLSSQPAQQMDLFSTSRQH